MNGNKTWDQDRGTQGAGGARDAVLYTVSISYPRFFPVAGLLGLPRDYEMTVTTILRNQPWTTQSRTISTGNCA